MNHYPRHIGDFVRDTVGLTMAERGAYTALLDQYYASEKPINDAEKYRICGAQSQSDRQAVDYILTRYFTPSSSGWRQKRADAEIALYQQKTESARKSANTRWKLDKERCERNANAMRTHCDGNASHKPLASSQEPVDLKSTAKSDSGPKPPDSDVVPLPKPNPNSERRQTAREILGFLNAKTGRNYRMVDANLGPIMARLKEGASERDFRVVIARKCREWGTDEKMAHYLRPATLFNATKFAQYVGEVPPETPDASALS